MACDDVLWNVEMSMAAVHIGYHSYGVALAMCTVECPSDEWPLMEDIPWSKSLMITSRG